MKPVLWDEPPANWKLKEQVKVAFAIPGYGPIYPQVYANHLAVAAYTSRYLSFHHLGQLPVIGASDKMYLHSACNAIVEDFLSSDCTHIFWTEQDMLMPFYTIVKLLEHDKDICSGVYFLRKGNGQPCLYLKGDASIHTGIHSAVPVTLFPEDSFFQVHCPGMGCVLMKREVFEKIEKPWFDLKEGWQGGKIYGYGQDIYWYSKVADAGLEVWVDSGIHCSQVMDCNVSLHDYRKRIADPEFKVIGAIITEGSPSIVQNADVPE
mgnify:CR=1 FL=1